MRNTACPRYSVCLKITAIKGRRDFDCSKCRYCNRKREIRTENVDAVFFCSAKTKTRIPKSELGCWMLLAAIFFPGMFEACQAEKRGFGETDSDLLRKHIAASEDVEVEKILDAVGDRISKEFRGVTRKKIMNKKFKKYYTPIEIADILEVSRRTIYRFIQRGDLAAYQFSDRGPVKIPAVCLRRFLEKRWEKFSEDNGIMPDPEIKIDDIL